MPPNADTPEVLLELRGVEHTYILPSGKPFPVVADIQFTLKAGELVALLGPSGCGKSTLVRIAAGLLRPTHGEVVYRTRPVLGPNPHVALVFQQFALYPWLTVAQNIEQALIPRGLDPNRRRQRVAEVISLIGLNGFEEAYPRELSGGMRQRVGIARALVVQPELLCMDEPFSQVDALTAETLRNEVVNLWRDREKYPHSILLVSHDIHEVTVMASRILIMTTNPGRIKALIDNPLPYPRDATTSAYQTLVDRLHGIITGLYLPEEPIPQVGRAKAGMPAIAPIPLIEVQGLVGLLQAIDNRGGTVALLQLTAEMGKAFTRILLAVKAAEFLGFVKTLEDDLVLTELGCQFVGAPRKTRRQLFRQQLLQLPLVQRLQEMAQHSPEHRLTQDVLLEELAIQCPQEEPKRLFHILMNWGRFADLWAYDLASARLILQEAAAPPAEQTVSDTDGESETWR